MYKFFCCFSFFSLLLLLVFFGYNKINTFSDNMYVLNIFQPPTPTLSCGTQKNKNFIELLRYLFAKYPPPSLQRTVSSPGLHNVVAPTIINTLLSLCSALWNIGSFNVFFLIFWLWERWWWWWWWQSGGMSNLFGDWCC